jgi:hypothetical protein
VSDYYAQQTPAWPPYDGPPAMPMSAPAPWDLNPVGDPNAWPLPHPAEPPYAGPQYGDQYGYYLATQYTEVADRRNRKRLIVWIVAGVTAVALVAIASIAAATSSPNRATASHLSVPAGPGVVFRYDAGQFAARFPSTPVTKTVHETVDQVRITVHAASDGPSQTVIEEEESSIAVPTTQGDDELRGIINGIAVGGNLTIGSQQDTTFDGHQARTADYTSATGVTMAAEAVFYSPTRAYVLLAPSDGFDDLVASFVPAP